MNNIRKKYLLILGFLAFSTHSSFGMLGQIGARAGQFLAQHGREAMEMFGDAVGRATAATAKTFDEIQKARAERARRDREEIERQRAADLVTINASWTGPIEKTLAEGRLKAADERLAAIKKQEDEFNAKVNEAAGEAMKLPGQFMKMGAEGLRDHFTAQAKLQEAVAVEHVKGKTAAEAAERSAKATGEAAIKKQKELLDFLSNPRNIKTLALGAAAVTATIFAAKEGFKLAADYIRHTYRNPELAEETSMVGFSDRMKDFLLGKKIIQDQVSDVILNAELAERIKNLADTTKRTVEFNTNFRNILFYGPPGTGKTMLAKKIARTCGLNYIYFAASDLDQFGTEEALMKLRELFNFAKKYKLMVIVDECENLLPKRSRVDLTEKTRKILTEVLTFFGTESKDFLFVGLTNRPEDLDDAALSRFDEQVEIPAPTASERNLILKKYINDFIKTSSTNKDQRNLTLLGKLLQMLRSMVNRMGLGKTAPTPRIMVAPDALGDDMMKQLTAQTAGFVGRDISKMILAMQVTALNTKDKTLTRDMMLRILKQKIEQKEKEKAGFRLI